MNTALRFLSLLIGLCLAGSANAILVDLNFLGSGGDFDFDSPTGTYTTLASDGFAGIQLSFVASVQGNTGDLNATASGFGVNAENIFVGDNDITSQLDGDQGLEAVRITFTIPATASSVTLSSLEISSFQNSGTGVDEGTYDINDAGSTSLMNGSNPVNTLISTADFLDVNFVSGSGFSLDGIRLDVAAVPEPTAFLFGGLVCGLVSLSKLRRSKPADVA